VREENLEGAQRSYRSNPDEEGMVPNHLAKQKKYCIDGFKQRKLGYAIWKDWSLRFRCRCATNE
jgi:hypothetical protein